MLLAIRANGPIIRLTDRGMLVDVRNGRPRRYVGKLSDYCALDWEVLTLDAFRKRFAAQPRE